MAEKFFREKYETHLKEIFPRDVLGVKKIMSTLFILQYGEWLQSGDMPKSEEIFNKVTAYALSSLALSSERKESLLQAVLDFWSFSETRKEFFEVTDDISRDPFFALVEDFSLDGEISKEEYEILHHEFSKEWNFLKALERLPDEVKNMFKKHIHLTLEHNLSEKKESFEWEYSKELKALKVRGYNVWVFARRISRFYYKTPGKYRKYEHPKRRLRRTMKLALLQILRVKLWNIDAQRILEKFEAGESFEDYFFLLYKLLEVIDENPSSEEIYSALKNEESIKNEVFSAEENKKKILEWESLVMSIASLFSRSESKLEEGELDEGLLGKILDESTDIIGEEVHFNREDDMAGVYAETSEENASQESQDELDSMSPRAAYELLSLQFQRIEEEKREAFLKWEYEAIDTFNNRLLDIQVKVEKLSKILGLEEE